MFKAGQDRHRGLRVEPVGRIDFGHIFGLRLEAVNDHVGVDAEDIADVDLHGRLELGQNIGIAGQAHKTIVLELVSRVSTGGSSTRMTCD